MSGRKTKANRNLRKEYHSFDTPAKCRSSVGGYDCSCCSPSLDKPQAHRSMRRAQKQSLPISEDRYNELLESAYYDMDCYEE